MSPACLLFCWALSRNCMRQFTNWNYLTLSSARRSCLWGPRGWRHNLRQSPPREQGQLHRRSGTRAENYLPRRLSEALTSSSYGTLWILYENTKPLGELRP